MRKHKGITIFTGLVCAIFLVGYLPAVLAAPVAQTLDYFIFLPLVIKQIPPTSEPQEQSPYKMDITNDGEYAYLSFNLTEAVFKIRLEDLSVVAVADLTEYFPIEYDPVTLNASEEKLFVYTTTWRKLIVLDTQTLNVIHTIDNISITGMTLSQYGPFLITWDGNTVRRVNTETYEITEFTDNSIGFLKIQESMSGEGLWYVLTGNPGEGMIIGLYDSGAKAWIHRFTIPVQGGGEPIADFKVLPNEQKAYVTTFGGWYPDYHAFGWLRSIDLVSGEINIVTIDGGAGCLEASPDSQRIYVGTGWPVPNTNNIVVIDTQSDSILDQIHLGPNEYGWPNTQINDVKIDPANPHLLYTTSSDGNAFIKVDLDTLTPVAVKVFNQERFHLHYSFVRKPGQALGYILVPQSPYAFELDLDQETIAGVVRFPNIRQDAPDYHIATNIAGNLLIPQGNHVLEVDPDDMSLLDEHPLPNTQGLWSFVLSHDKTSLFSIWPGPTSGGFPDTFLRINPASFQEETRVKLEGGNFDSMPFELPDGSKLYALGGQQNGQVVIHVFETDTYTIQKTIIFDSPGLQGIVGGPAFPFAYDSNSHTLFAGATQVVLAIDTNSDAIKKVIYLGDVARAIGLEPWQLTYLNAIGLVYNPQENYLYIAHLDRSFISIYDLDNDRFLPQIIDVKGIFPNSLFANDDLSKIYTVNNRSDSVSVIDVFSKTVEKVIDLHDYLSEP